MAANLIAKAEISIHAPAAKVWEALTRPEYIKEYFHGTQAVSDWNVGSKLEFKGTWEGEEYLDKGIILRSEPPRLFQYTHFSSRSGMEDAPENYANITYSLDETDGETVLQIKQENIDNEKAREHSEKNWNHVLNIIKEIVEKQMVTA